MLGPHRLLCGDATSKTDVAMCLGAVRPLLMVTDPPYGVAYDPKWRAYADVNKNRGKLGAVANDDRADWREAWALFPGDVAYCWHAGKHASDSAGLARGGRLRDAGADHLGEGPVCVVAW